MALKVPFHRAKEAQLILTLKIIDSYTKGGELQSSPKALSLLPTETPSGVERSRLRQRLSNQGELDDLG
jgi:hypothetical protein